MSARESSNNGASPPKSEAPLAAGRRELLNGRRRRYSRSESRQERALQLLCLIAQALGRIESRLDEIAQAQAQNFWSCS
jgi:hypothetical protein